MCMVVRPAFGRVLEVGSPSLQALNMDTPPVSSFLQDDAFNNVVDEINVQYERLVTLFQCVRGHGAGADKAVSCQGH